MAYLKGKVTLPDGRVVDAQIRGRIWMDDFTPYDEKVEATLPDGTELTEEELTDELDEFIYLELEHSGVVYEEDYDPED